MNLGRGRARRPDDWPSSHVRARSALSDRLDAPLDPAEATWLDAHLEACADCRAIAAGYAAQQLELRALRDRMPTPPRDLWARTAAAIESEARFRDSRARTSPFRNPRRLAPTALLAAALVVAVAVGTLYSSQRPGGGGAAGPSDITALASIAASTTPSDALAGPTPIPVARNIAYVARESGGSFTIKVRNVNQVCPPDSAQPCDTSGTVEDRPVNLDQDAATVFGAPDAARLIVVNDPASTNSGTISVVPLSSEVPIPTSSPSATPAATPSVAPPSRSPAVASATPTLRATPTPTPRPSRSPATPSPTPTETASATPTETASASPSPSVSITPAPDGGSIEIAHDVVLVGQSAAYSPSGRWFAFTARPSDGSVGPDIYVWKVGDGQANPVTTDHRSVFGSWTDEMMVGSTVVDVQKGNGNSPTIDLSPTSFLLDPETSTTTGLPQTGRAWRPAVDPTGRLAVYWAGTLRATDGPGFAPDRGRLVLGDWGTGASAPSGGPLPTPLTDDQGDARHETTIAAGRMDDWDARWDATGTHLAVWIADQKNPAIGRLSLYSVDSFDGKIDLKTPLLDARLASAGFSISDGQLVWAEATPDGGASGKIQLLAWTDEGVGTVETITGPVIVIR